MEVEIYKPKTDSLIGLHLNLFLSDPPNFFLVQTESNCEVQPRLFVVLQQSMIAAAAGLAL